jgi:AcrR family transcriptional regulator
MSAAASDRRVLRARALRDKRRIEILEAARKVFARRGYLGASIADIIEEAKIARGTFYLHFESKRSIFGEVLEDLLEQLKGVFIRVDIKRTDASPYDQLLDNVERVLDVLVMNADLARILLRTAGGQDDEFDQKLGEFYDDVLALVRDSLSDGVKMGIVRDVDLVIYASCVLGSVKETVDHLLLRQTSSARMTKKRAATKRSARVNDRTLAAYPGGRRAIAKKLLDYNLFGILVR